MNNQYSINKYPILNRIKKHQFKADWILVKLYPFVCRHSCLPEGKVPLKRENSADVYQKSRLEPAPLMRGAPDRVRGRVIGKEIIETTRK